MSTSTPPVAELVPIADRTRWMLGCRALLVLVLFLIWLVLRGPVGTVPAVIWLGLVWIAVSATLSAAAMRTARREGRGRWLAVLGFTIGLLGDGLLLALGYYDFDGLDGPVWYLIVLHGVAVTLLASFRTGAKLALWHSLIALVIVEATAAGVLHPDASVNMSPRRLGLYLIILWASVMATASFAAVNERELRRRRRDSEVLRRFGVALSDESDTVAISRHLARFAREELPASRAVVLVQPCHDGAAVAGAAHAVVIVGDEEAQVMNRLDAEVVTQGVLATALADRRTHLVAHLDTERDRWLAETLPDAENLVIEPFALEQVVGAVVVEHPRRAMQGRVQHAERRTVSTTEQATSHASMAIGRAVLVERIRATAEMDGLTQVANRRRLDAVTAKRVTDADPFALIMVAVDDFKQLNDRYGHLTGDDVLRRAARQIADAAGEAGFTARYGGAEFAVIIPATERRAAIAVAERISAAVRAADTPVPVSASVGVALFPADASTPTGLLAGAGTALQAAKLNVTHGAPAQ